jgi:hypothetical protein
MSIVLSCKTKDIELKSRLEQYARANGLSKSKAIEDLLNQALQKRDKNGFTAGIPKDCREVNGLLRKLAEVEAKIKQIVAIVKKVGNNR